MQSTHRRTYGYVNRLLRHLVQWHASVATGPIWFPELDVSEGDDVVLIRVDLPGVEPSDIHISVDPCGVTVAGQRHEAPHLTHGFRRYERRFGSFRRWTPLPAQADVSGTRAVLSNGVLEIRIPRNLARKADEYPGAAVYVQAKPTEIPIAISNRDAV